jgi:hypothetical protein
MPLDVSGNYSLPAVYNVTSGTVISSADYKTVLEDIRAALNLAVYRDGRAALTAAISGVAAASSAQLVTKSQLDAVAAAAAAATADRAITPVKQSLVALSARTASATLVYADERRPVTIDTTGGAVTLTMPAANAAGNPGLIMGPFQWIAGSNAATLSAAVGETINGSLTLALPFGSSVFLISTSSTAWRAIGVTDAQALIDPALGETDVTIASAATTDALAAASINVAVSGTATITSFGTTPNRRRKIRATGAFTITHNATTLICPTAANIVAAADDTFEIVSDASGNVRLFNYTRATGAPLFNAAAKFVDRAYAESSSIVDVGTPIIPLDNTIPQNTEGTQAITCTITPKNSANIIRVQFSINVFVSGARTVPFAVFQGATANAVHAGIITQSSSVPGFYSGDFEVVAGTTSSVTFAIRIGPSASPSAGFMWTNTSAAGPTGLFGGASKMTLMLTEMLP